MIEWFYLKNFQKHQSRKIILDSGVTTIIGPNGAGKSCILRAIRWLCLNKPVGDFFIKRGEQFTIVKAKVDGKIVLRKKGKKSNLYKIDDKVFKSFGAGTVPEEVQNLLNIEEVNFQMQHDSSFWISDTPGQVSKALNKIVNLDVMDGSMAYLSSRLRLARSSETTCLNRINEAKKELSETAWIKEYSTKLSDLQNKCTLLSEKRLQCDRVAITIENLTSAKTTLQSVANAATGAANLVAKTTTLFDKKTELKRLGKTVEEISKWGEILKNPLPNITDFEKKFDRWKLLKTKKDKLRKLIKEISKERKCLKQLKIDLRSAVLDLKEKRKGKCPLCNRGGKTS